MEEVIFTPVSRPLEFRPVWSTSTSRKFWKLAYQRLLMIGKRGVLDIDDDVDVPNVSLWSTKVTAVEKCHPSHSPQSDAVVSCVSGAKPLCHSVWTANRNVSSLRWLRSSEETLFASYARASKSRREQPIQNDADGVVVAWDVKAGEPRRAFTNSSSLTSLVAPHALSPALIFAGSADGELVLWDTRSRLPAPVVRSDVCGAVPVRGLEAADESSPYVVSTSANGNVSVWALANMTAPVETTTARERGLRDVRPSALAIPRSSAFQQTPGTSTMGKRAAVMLGCEDGGVYRVHNADQEWTTDHAAARVDGPITSLDCHPGHPRYPQLGDLAISSCFDGSVSMWSFGRRGAGLRVKRFALESGEPCSDVQWAPSHPGAFAAVDIAGGLTLFDVSRAEGKMCLGRYDSPVTTANLDSRGTASPALNRLQWNHESSFIATGSVTGDICIWRPSESLRNSGGSSWEVVSATARQWRADETIRIGKSEQLAVPESYPFAGLPPVFNPLHKS